MLLVGKPEVDRAPNANIFRCKSPLRNDLRSKFFSALSSNVYALPGVGYDALLWIWEKSCVNTSNHEGPGPVARSTSGVSEAAWAVHTTVEFSFRPCLFQTYDE